MRSAIGLTRQASVIMLEREPPPFDAERIMSRLVLTISIALALTTLACADIEPEVSVQEEVKTHVQTVSVVPAFSITGISSLPSSLYLTELGFVVSEIRLEPLVASPGSVAFSAVKPEIIRFDVSSNEMFKKGAAIDLPRPGRYLVSVRLEPIDEETSDESISSFSMSGFVARDSMLGSEYVTDGEDGERPTPHPFDPDDDDIRAQDADGLSDNPQAPDAWAPFYYHSERAVFFTLNDVEFEAGEQQLEFTFDLHNWALDIVEPISRAVSYDETITDEHAGGVDISRHLDSSGQGAESFVTFGRVETMPGGF